MNKDKTKEELISEIGLLQKRIAELEKAEAECEEAKNIAQGLNHRMEFILAATKTGLDIIDSDFNMVFIDPEWAKTYGDYKGKKCYKYFMGRSKICPDCAISNVLKTKKSMVSEEILVKEGNRPVRITTIPFQDKDGKWMVAEVNVDITESKKVEEELRKSEIKFENLVKCIPDKIFIKDTKLTYIFCNKNYADSIKMAPEEIIGKTDFDLFPKGLSEKYRSDDKRIMETGKIEEIEEKYTKNGEERWAHTVKAPYKDEKGKTIGILGIFRDITERKKMEEELERKNELLEKFNKAAVGRELKMIELKSEIDTLKRRLNDNSRRNT